MAGSVSKTILVGNIGKDVEIKNSGNGKAFAVFSVATSQSWKDKESGDRKERTEWHNIKVFAEPLVKFAEHHLHKGSKVYIEGENRTRKWEKDGQTHYTTDVVLDGFSARLEGLDRADGDRPPETSGPDEYGTSSSRPAKGGAAAPASMDDDIPFAPEWR